MNMEKEALIVALILFALRVGLLYLIGRFIQTVRDALTT